MGGPLLLPIWASEEMVTCQVSLGSTDRGQRLLRVLSWELHANGWFFLGTPLQPSRHFG